MHEKIVVEETYDEYKKIFYTDELQFITLAENTDNELDELCLSGGVVIPLERHEASRIINRLIEILREKDL